MSTIEIVNGDLESALHKFKLNTADTVAIYKRKQTFTSAQEERRRIQHIKELKRKSKEQKLLQIKEQYRREGKVFYDN